MLLQDWVQMRRDAELRAGIINRMEYMARARARVARLVTSVRLDRLDGQADSGVFTSRLSAIRYYRDQHSRCAAAIEEYYRELRRALEKSDDGGF